MGTLVHELLERVDLKQDSIEFGSCESCPYVTENLVDEKTIIEAIRLVNQLLQSDLKKELLEAKHLYREVDFILKWKIEGEEESSEKIIFGQIDCLFQSQDGHWHIWDYKTGSLHQGQHEKLIRDYELQMTIYSLAVKQLFSTLPESVCLISIQESVEQIPVELTAEKIEEITARVNQSIQSVEKTVGV